MVNQSMRRDACYPLGASGKINRSLPSQLLVFGVFIGIIHIGAF